MKVTICLVIALMPKVTLKGYYFDNLFNLFYELSQINVELLH